MKDHPELRFGGGLEDVPERWPVSSSEVVHQTGRVISVRRDTVQPDGRDSFVRDVVVHPGAVGVVALDGANRMLLVRLFSGEYDALTVLKMKEVADELEAACDAFEHVANTVETIAVKES